MQSWCDNEPKFRLSLQPEYPFYDEITNRIEALQDEHRKGSNSERQSEYQAQPTYQQRVIDKCLILTESLHPPKKFNLDSIYTDDQLIGKFVQTVGHLKIHSFTGDVYLSSHIVEEANNPCDNFDPIRA